MANCKFEEALVEMKGVLNKALASKLASDETKGIIRAKLAEIAKMELQVRKLQGTVRVTSGIPKVEVKQTNGKIDVTDPVGSMLVIKQKAVDKETNRSNMLVFWTPWAKASMDRNVRIYNTWQEKDAAWLRAHGMPVPKKLLVSSDVPSAYYNAMDYLVKETVKPGVKAIADLTEALIDEDGMKFAKYDRSKNDVTTYSYTNANIYEYIKDREVEKYVDETTGENVSGEDKAMIEAGLKENKAFTDALVGNHTNNKAFIEMWAGYIASRNPVVLSHELVHAGASKYMMDNPESELTKRVEELYRVALGNKYSIDSRTGGDSYWSTNVHEFLAEGLTNPLVMQALSSIPVEDKAKVGMFKELIEIALKMLGFNGSTVYSELLNSYMQVVKENREYKPELVEMAKNILQGMKDC